MGVLGSQQRPNRVAMIWAANRPLVNITVRYERYARGFQALGWEPITVCLPGAAEGYTESVVLAPSEADLRDPAFYRSLRIDAAVVITWLGIPDVVAAAKAACPWVVSIADSDGKVGVRVHPRSTFLRMTAQHRKFGLSLRAAKYWLQLYFAGPEELDKPVLDSASHADRIDVGSLASAGHLRAFFDSYRRPDLAAKVAVVPYPIDECYIASPISSGRPARIVAIGRWDDPQKNAGLLRRAIGRHCEAGGQTEFLLIGPSGDLWFASLARRWLRVRYLGLQGPEAISEHLRSSRAILLPSRWEGSPIVLNEALASGCTVIGTDAVPAVVSACDQGYGTMATGGSASSLAAAIDAEMAAWDRGDRDPAAISAHWQHRLHPATICGQLLPKVV